MSIVPHLSLSLSLSLAAGPQPGRKQEPDMDGTRTSATRLTRVLHLTPQNYNGLGVWQVSCSGVILSVIFIFM